MNIDTVSRSAAGSSAPPVAPLPGNGAVAKATSAPAPAVPMAAAASIEQATSADAARQAARQINEFLKSFSAAVEFSVDDRTNEIVVRVVDTETNQVVRQMPSEDAIAISHALDRVSGLLLQQKA